MAKSLPESSSNLDSIFKSPSGLTIRIKYGDITEAVAEAIVVPEGSKFRNLGLVAKSLIDMYPKFEKVRDKLIIENKAKFKRWDVYTSEFGKTFKHVLHAIVTPCAEGEDEKEWRRQMGLLYTRIFREADRKTVSILAVPLLASGKGGASPEDAIELAMESVVQFKPSLLKTVMFVCKNKEMVVKMASRCDWECKGRPKSATRPLPPKPTTNVWMMDAPQNLKKDRPQSGRPLPQPNRANVNVVDQSISGPKKDKVTSDKTQSLKGSKANKKNEKKSQVPNLHIAGTSFQNDKSPVKENTARRESCDTGKSPENTFERDDAVSRSRSGNEKGVNNSLLNSVKRKETLTKGERSSDSSQHTYPMIADEDKLKSGDNGSHMDRNTDGKTNRPSVKENPVERKRETERKRLKNINFDGRKDDSESGKKAYLKNSNERQTNSNEDNKDAKEGELHQTTDNDMNNDDTDSQTDHTSGEPRYSEPTFVNARQRDSVGSTSVGLESNMKLDPTENRSVSATRNNNSDFRNGTQNFSSPRQNGRDILNADTNSSQLPLSCDKGDQDHRMAWTGGNSSPTSGKGGHATYRKSENDINASKGARPKQKTKYAKQPPDSGANNENTKDVNSQTCPICLEDIKKPKRLPKCGHVFCRECIDDSFKQYKPVCPSCNMVYEVFEGNQPKGDMNIGFSGDQLSGFEPHGTIAITYSFESGIQKKEHPNPGLPYKGTTRHAYLPDCPEGRKVLKLLRTAFDRRLTFTIGRSTTTGKENVITWNDIHHKTSMYGGPTKFGYPDPGYLDRVKDELASRGIS